MDVLIRQQHGAGYPLGPGSPPGKGMGSALPDGCCMAHPQRSHAASWTPGPGPGLSRRNEASRAAHANQGRPYFLWALLTFRASLLLWGPRPPFLPFFTLSLSPSAPFLSSSSFSLSSPSLLLLSLPSPLPSSLPPSPCCLCPQPVILKPSGPSAWQLLGDTGSPTVGCFWEHFAARTPPGRERRQEL